MDKKQIYLDNAATTKVHPDVLDYMLPFLKEQYGNPSGIYDLGADNNRVLLDARRQIGELLQCEPQSIYFTSGGTESDNWALKGIAEKYQENGKHIITTKIEHHAIINTCKYLEKRGFEITYLDVDEMGMVRPEQIQKALRPDTILVSVMYANNEIGTINPIREIGEIVKPTKALFHTDAVQAVGQIPVIPDKCHIDLLSASSHKFRGPKGSGFLYIRNGVKIEPFMHGGKQERGTRAGTENVPGIAGMGLAAKIANETLEKKALQESELRDYMIHRIESEIPYCRLNGSRKHRLPNNVNFSFLHLDGENLVILMDMEGVCCSSGSACTAGQSVSSHVLTHIGLPSEMSKGSIRFTLGEDTTEADIDDTVERLKKVVEKSRNLNPMYQAFIKANQKR